MPRRGVIGGSGRARNSHGEDFKHWDASLVAAFHSPEIGYLHTGHKELTMVAEGK
jgi:hypothetical protein